MIDSFVKYLREDSPPIVIAELSANHNGSLGRALETVEAAVSSGVDAIKLQTYRPDTMTIDCKNRDFLIDNRNSPWHGQYLYQLYEDAHTPWEWHEPIFERSQELGVECFSTPFDVTAVDFLEKLEVPAYKIASFENNHYPLLKKVSATGKPIFLSTGTATFEELTEAVNLLKKSGAKDIFLLKCTSAYPALAKNANVVTLNHMKNLFGVGVGISDHTLGFGVAVAAVACGARVIEKHFTLNRSDGGPDSSFSMEPGEMEILVNETKRAWEALGTVDYEISNDERSSLVFRRSIYAIDDIPINGELTSSNIDIIRPGYGLHPRFYSDLLGRRARTTIPRGAAIDWSLLEDV